MAAQRRNRTRPEIKFAPREVFDQLLEWSVIPTFDLVVELPDEAGVVLVRRTIAPYENCWALPGLRMFKGEGIDDVIARIAEDELGVEVDVDGKRFLGQYVGRFKTENERQDLSSGYVVKAFSSELRINTAHFSGHRVIKKHSEVPPSTGAMYRFYLSRYFDAE
ncbi:NUDIX domain-containing protein [Actinoallomurus sp. NPDC052308]|uniref:NUDIX domain-containing protein n=1 Tax=Actinoallomurus sp. NPDC052308 TaxID=3155530 RepID=UPI003429505D